jgi:FixJ family two-component response regulator
MIARRPGKVGLICPARRVTSQILESMSQQDTIAVVDDDAGIRDALEQLLTSWGYCVELYSSGEEFIRAATFSAAACLLVDIQLGDISGVELGRYLAASGFIFPTVFMTGALDELTRRQATDFGCVAYLKPLKAAELKKAIDLAIGKNDRK